MASLAGVLSFDEEWSPHGLAKKLAKDACRYPQLHSKILLQDSRVSCYVVEKRLGNPKSIVVPISDTQTMAFVGQIADPDITHQNLVSKLTAPIEDALLNLNGFWNAMIYDQAKQSIRFVTDLLGVAWMYVARFEKGFIFCSDFGALVSNYPGSLKADHQAMLSILGLHYPPDDTTCFEEVSILPEGSVVELTQSGVTKIKKKQIEYGDRYASLSQSKKFEILDSVLDKSIKAWCGTNPSELLISLSGGLDSRYGLGLLKKHPSKIQCMTFGHPRSVDVRTARVLCDTVGFPLSHYNATHTSWEVWKSCIERLGAAGGYQYVCGWSDDWLNLLSHNGSQVIIGFVGDAFSGKHLEPMPHNKGNWVRDWEDWSLDEGWATSGLLKPFARKKLYDGIRSRYSEVCRDASFAFPHQRALHLDLVGRQRRYVASQVNLIFMFLCPLPFFYTKEGIEFWANLPFEDLNKQALYKSYARKRFPDLFKPEARPRLYRRIWGTLTNEVIKLIPDARPFLSPTEVDHRGLLAQNREHILRLVEHMNPLIEHFFDTKKLLDEIHAYPNSRQLNWIQLTRLTNLLILASLSESREGHITH